MFALGLLRYKQTMSRRAPLSSVLFFTAVAGLGQTPQPPPATNPLHIRIVEGDAAINSIRFHRAHDPVVQVLDEKGAPVGGVTVTFLLPATGPGGTFDNN